MLSKIKISFYISGDGLGFDAIEKELDLQPTCTRKKNEWPQASILAGIAKNVWELQLEQEESTAVSIQLDKLREYLSPSLHCIKHFCEIHSLSTSVVAVINMGIGDAPELVISRENISFLSAINAEFSLDMYIDEEATRRGDVGTVNVYPLQG